jgi:hypothetical protein
MESTYTERWLFGITQPSVINVDGMSTSRYFRFITRIGTETTVGQKIWKSFVPDVMR